MNESTPNRLLPCLDGFLKFIFKYEQEGALSIDNDGLVQLRHEIVELLQRYELNALEVGIDAESLHKSKYALVAFIDEWILKVVGQQASSWMINPLQLELFGETTAGERFFEFLNQLRLQADYYIDVLELYYLLLELGFEGQYRLNDKNELIRLKQALLKQIQHIRRIKINDFFLQNAQRRRPITKRTYSPFKKAIIVSCSFILLFALGANAMIRYQMEHSKQSLSQFNQMLAEVKP